MSEQSSNERQPRRRFFTAPSLERAVLEASAFLETEPGNVVYERVAARGLSRGKGVTIRVDHEATALRMAGVSPSEESPEETPTEEAVVAEAAGEGPAAAAEPALEAVAEAAPEEAAPEQGEAEAPLVEAEVGAPVEHSSESAELATPEAAVVAEAAEEPEAVVEGEEEDEEPLFAAEQDSEGVDAVEDPQEVAAADGAASEESPAEPPTLGDRIELPSSPVDLFAKTEPASTEVTESGTRWVDALLDLAELDLSVRVEERGEQVWFDLVGPDADLLLEDSGQVLESVQHLLPRLMQSDLGRVVSCVADSNGFREYHLERLRTQAVSSSEAVRSQGRAISLEPMNPPDRRAVHMALADDPAVETESSGRGYFKRITVRPS